MNRHMPIRNTHFNRLEIYEKFVEVLISGQNTVNATVPDNWTLSKTHQAKILCIVPCERKTAYMT